MMQNIKCINIQNGVTISGHTVFMYQYLTIEAKRLSY